MNKYTEDITLNTNLIKYLDNDLTESEGVLIKEWIDDSLENKAYFEKVMELWQSNLSDIEKQEFGSVKGWSNFTQNFDFKAQQEAVINPTYRFKSLINSVLKAVAVLVLGLILWQTGVFKPKTIVVSTIEYKEETILPDNTSVYLNNNTQLAFSKKLKKKKIRKVKLSGEAFFNVEPNANKPFVIYTHDVKIEVIGTSFNVRSYPDEATEVTVKSGVVKVTQLNKVEDVNEPVVLKKGDKVAIDTINFANAAQVNDNPNYLSWKTESYAFDSVSINKVMETLQRGFDTTIVVKNPDFNDCMLVAKFDSLYLNEIFWILQRTYNISVKRSNDTIYIDGKGCK